MAKTFFDVISKLKKNTNGNVDSRSLNNVELILNNDENLINSFAFNEFSNSIELIRDIEINDLEYKKGNIGDFLITRLRSYIEKNYEAHFSPELIYTGIQSVADENRINPVKDYFIEAHNNWDGKYRIEGFFRDYLGVMPDISYTLINNIFFLGVIGKVFEDNFKFDYVLDLVGGQGAGKTTILKKLSNGWYTDQFKDFSSPDSYMVMNGNLIVNDDEMEITNRSGFAEIKKFITMDKMQYRLPYARSITNADKNFVLVRTTNELFYLKDKTGERRFLPLLVNKDAAIKNPVTDLTDEEVKQIWGEASNVFDFHKENGTLNKQFDLEKTELAFLERHRKSFMYKDEVEEMIDDYLTEHEGIDFIPNYDLADFMFGEYNFTRHPKEAKKIKNILINRGWVIKRKWIDNQNVRGYELKNN